MKILVSDEIARKGIELLEKEGIKAVEKFGLSEEELVKEAADADAMIVRSGTKVTGKVIDAAKNLKVIARAGTGLDNIDLKAAEKKGIKVVNTPAANAVSAAEQTIAVMLSLCRNIPHAHFSLESGEWKRSKFKGTELSGKTIGIIGFGHVGRIVAKMLSGFEAKILAFDPFASKEDIERLEARKATLEELLKESDFVSLHVPLTKETKNMIGEKELKQMKKEARIVNVARGGLIDEKALYDALVSGEIAGAALDVYPKEPPEFRELLSLENVVSTPHLGASTKEAQERCGVQAAEKVIEELKGN